jgi:nucleoside-diphosphate-sugar epimerase
VKRVVVTGGTGFLGCQVVHGLLARGDRVVVLTRNAAVMAQGRLSAVRERLEILPLTVDGMEAAVAGGVDAVIHSAASYGRAGETAAALVAANVQLPLALAEVCGTRIGRWLAVGTALPRQVSPYALSKAQCADWLQRLPATALAPRVHLAFQQFYGPGDDATKFPTFLARRCLAGGPVPLTAGTQVRDFLHVSDAVAALVTLLDAPLSGLWQDVPVGSGTGIAVRDFAERVNAVAGGRADLLFGAIPTREGEPAACVADPAILRSLGWSPRIALDQGIAELVAAEQTASAQESRFNSKGEPS